MTDDERTAYESGARKLVERPDLKNDDLIHTGDPADEPKRPYGLTESSGDRGDATRHHDGRRPPDKSSGVPRPSETKPETG